MTGSGGAVRAASRLRERPAASVPSTAQAGFTLVEILICVVLVGTILLALAGGMLTLARTSNATTQRQQIQLSLGSYTESLTLDQARRNDVLVAYELEGKQLAREHGGPVRLYVAPMYGYKSLKWLETIEVVDRVEPGYWEQQGYDVDGWVGKSNGRDDNPTS